MTKSWSPASTVGSATCEASAARSGFVQVGLLSPMDFLPPNRQCIEEHICIEKSACGKFSVRAVEG
jgi:hypothetical protein